MGKEGSFALLQSDKRNYKMGQLIYYKVGQCNYNEGIVSKRAALGQIGARVITKWSR